MTFSTLVVHEPNKYLVLYRNVHRSARHVWRCVNVSQKPSNSSNNNTTRWLEEIVWQNRKNIMDERIFHIFLMLGKPSCLDSSVNKHIRVRYAMGLRECDVLIDTPSAVCGIYSWWCAIIRWMMRLCVHALLQTLEILLCNVTKDNDSCFCFNVGY